MEFGIKRAQFKNRQTRIAFKIDVVIESAESGAQESIVITPTEVNLLWEASSYTPAILLWQSSPASDAEVTVIAMPGVYCFKREEAFSKGPYIYMGKRWKSTW